MSAKASSSQPGGFSGSAALSHVYVQYPPLRCNVTGSRNLFYDDGNKLLLALTSNQVFSWKMSPFDPHVAPSSDSIGEGPVLYIRYSLDLKHLAIQRSSREVEIRNRETGEHFIQKCRSESESILGFFWTDCPTCDLVFVKTSGLELFSYKSETKSLQLVETRKTNVSWYIYTHESRLVLLASGMQCKSFTGFQLSSAGIVRLPRFEMTMTKSEANNKPVLAAEDVHIITVYGRIYCLQFDRVATLLHCYRFYRDAVIQQGSLPIYSNRIAVSVVDNILLVHQVDAKVVIIYDIFSDSRAPVSAPLPLLLRGSATTYTSSSQTVPQNFEASAVEDSNSTGTTVYGDDWTFLVPDLICDVGNGLLWKINIDLEAISASSSEVPALLEFLQRRKLEPNKVKQLCLTITRTIILERRPIPMVSRAIDVLIASYIHSVKTGSYNKGANVEKSSPSGVSNVNTSSTIVDNSINRADASGKSIKHEPSGGMESQPIAKSAASTTDSEDNSYFDIQNIGSGDLNSSSAITDRKHLTGADEINELHLSAIQSQLQGPDSAPLNVNSSGQQLTSPAISPDDLYTSVFSPVEEEMSGDASYLVTIIIEFLRSANQERLKVHPNTYVLTVRLLARDERYSELGLFIINKIIEPSKEVALQLLESGRQDFQTRKLGLDILRQLSLHHDYVLLLVQDGYYLEALRYARKNKVNTVRPSLFLEAAYSSNNSQHLATVLRFFCDFIPGFKSTSDHNSYSRILADMISAVTV